MHLLYNGQTMPEQDLLLPLSNRAFQYNDGFFETIMVHSGKVNFWPDHLARMQEAASALKMDLPQVLLQPHFEEQLLRLAQLNEVKGIGRCKLKVWRAGAGIYTPETNQADWLLTVVPTAPSSAEPLHMGISKSVYTHHSPLSHFKGPNAPLYVMAGIEKNKRELDDLLLLSPQHAVAECISSNIFWIQNGQLFTPAVTTGCVNGILRRNILRVCEQQQLRVQEGSFQVEQLLQAEAVFAANVTGIRIIGAIEERQFATGHALVNLLKEALQL